MTRNAMLCVLQNLITKKHQHFEVSRADEPNGKCDDQLASPVKSKRSKKSQSKSDANDGDNRADANDLSAYSKPKKRCSLKASFFLRKSR